LQHVYFDSTTRRTDTVSDARIHALCRTADIASNCAGALERAGFDRNSVDKSPVLKTHGGTGIGALKHCYGFSMVDIPIFGTSCRRNVENISLVRAPDLNILDCIWVSPESLSGYPPSATHRADILLAGIDPVALDYFAAKHVLQPLGGSPTGEHDPDNFAGLRDHLKGASDFININGGINGKLTDIGDDNIEVFSASAAMPAGNPIPRPEAAGRQQLLYRHVGGVTISKITQLAGRASCFKAMLKKDLLGRMSLPIFSA
jgi:hypothetical protein